MPNAGEANSDAHDAMVTSDNMPVEPELSVDEQIAQAEDKLAQAEQHLADAKDAKAHWTKTLKGLRKG